MNSVLYAFAGLPLGIQIFFWIVLVIVVASFVSAVVLLMAGTRERLRQRRMIRGTRERGHNESDFLWVFMVPALNESAAIADSVSRLRQTKATHTLFVVIDDGSDDGTGQIVSDIADERIRVLSRVLPNARTGKAAALNDAYGYLRRLLRTDPALSAWDETNTIVCVVDADGRLSADAPFHVAPHFVNPRTGGVQSLVHIYNQHTSLTWAQNVEFSSFGRLFKLGRSAWGAANMGGNGQFNRLSALTDISTEEGPWRHRLTEDQDLGVRLLQRGWRSVQENRAVISQQGLNSLSRLFRQRVRWAQGAWECMDLIPTISRMKTGLIGRIDALHYLLTPLQQLMNGLGFLTSILLNILLDIPFLQQSLWALVFFIGLGVGPSLIALVYQAPRWYLIPVYCLLVVPYMVYSWIIFPVLISALIRHLSGRTAWVKTGRETIDGQVQGETQSAPMPV